jgi:hypothetical protein
MRAINQTRNVVLVEHGSVAANLWSRLRGLLGRPPLQAGNGLLLRGEKAIHTVGMGYPIDVLFLDRAGRVVHLYHSMPPLRASPYVRRAQDILELPPGILAKTGTVLGDVITLVDYA